MKKIILSVFVLFAFALFAQAENFEPCAKQGNNLTYEEDNPGSDNDFSVTYELKFAQFVEARYDSPSYWRYVFVQENYSPLSNGDTSDLLSSKVGKDVSYLPKWVTLYVYETAELSATQKEKLAKLNQGERANQYNILEEGKKIAVLTTSETLQSNYLADFYGNFFPKIKQCGDEDTYIRFAQYPEI